MRIVFFLFIVFVKSFSLENYNNSFSIPLHISVQRPILSPKNNFKLGFFKSATSSRVGDRWYLGIWYRRFGDQVVWVANRDTPLSKPNGTLQIFNNKVHLLDQYGNSVWSANGTSQSRLTLLTGELLDDGNLVLRYSDHNSSRLFWQSFDFPTDTLLPGMKIGLDKKSGLMRILRSWKDIPDPSSGDYIYKVEIHDPPEIYVRSKGEPVVRVGPWNSVSDRDAIGNWRYFTNNFVENSEEISYSFSISNASYFSMLRMDYSGSLTRFIWSPRSGKMEMIYQNLPNDACDMYNKCGPYGLCDINTAPVCSCMEGFQARHQEAWERNITEKGCVRKTQQKCYGDRFIKLQTMKLPDTSNSVVNKTIGLKECKERCLNNCNCTAYANENMENGGSGCVIWLGELLDIRKYKNAGQDLYVRVEHIDTGKNKKEGNNNTNIIIVFIIVGLVILLFAVMFCVWKRKKRPPTKAIEAPIAGELHFEPMELQTVVMATQEFSDSNKIGQGGFGIVYKGRLLDGKEIAVKRLLKMSIHGIDGFRNELSLIGSVQHVNLVQLLGYCFEGGEMILIYEYLENSSLDTYIFDESQSSKLNWEKRVQIINGIARGLLYLHQDSRCPIVHRDLKPSNVLLDNNMVPKIADFGMAKIFDKDKTEANTTKIVGTYGYMSPEYAEDGTYSSKSDVFSFGVLVLEIICGKRNREYYKYSKNEESLLNYIWRCWKEGKELDIIDPVILDTSTFRPHLAIRCIQIRLLCVQDRADDRPTMLSVSVMLASETVELALPEPPGYLVRRSPLETGSSSRKKRNEESCTVAEVTYSAIDPR